MFEEDDEDYELEFQNSPLRGRSPPPSPFHSFPSPTAPPSPDASVVGEANTVDTSSSEDSVSHSSESNFEGCNVVLPYQCDPSFKNREDLEQFLKGCDSRVEDEHCSRLQPTKNCGKAKNDCWKGVNLDSKSSWKILEKITAKLLFFQLHHAGGSSQNSRLQDAEKIVRILRCFCWHSFV